jgi:D-alanyl-lipoteichoic acid acyltransferase DltB (MBOAT superfamily)
LLFNSIDFLIFLPLIFCLYWLLDNISLKLQNLLIVISSYVFYGWWDWRFLSLIVISTLVDYSIGCRLKKEILLAKRKKLLLASILVNLGLLGFFKYYNFFLDNFISAFSFFGATIEANSLNIILPVGVSFYTFQTMSYTIDVYRKKLEPTNDLIAFSAFVSFFPQLVAGPIERATNLLPQFYQKRNFEYSKAIDGMRQILWGFFKKMVIADNCADFANKIFANPSVYSGSALALGATFFAFQIYGDFSGYSDIAIGTARLFGINLKKNFAFPYFSRDIAEFWRRWHISLSTWFKDYLYIPLGGSRGGTVQKIRNTLVIFVVSGFWHGANWTFIAWGVLNAVYYLPLMLLNQNRNHEDSVAKGKIIPSIKDVVLISFTFCQVLVAWVFFRARTLLEAKFYLCKMFSISFFSSPNIQLSNRKRFLVVLIIFCLLEWLQRDKEHTLQLDNLELPKVGKWLIYYLILFCTLFMARAQTEFIYFQF